MSRFELNNLIREGKKYRYYFLIICIIGCMLVIGDIMNLHVSVPVSF